MSKAITGAIEIAAGVVLVATGVGAAFGWSLIAMGASEELAEVASLLQSRNGTATTVRQAAAPRRVIYGTQRVGAVEVFESTTGGNKDQYNMVLVFAAHEITNFLELHLDGRQVFFAGGGVGYTVRNGIGFGGGADGQNHIAPNGSTYNFANASSGHRGVWVEARHGDQSAGDWMTSLQANDGRWAPANGDTPTLQGHAYLYLKCEFNTDDFPQKPDARATIAGKAVYDPRTGTTAYSDNWALVVADILTNTDYGLGCEVNQAQLIAAANTCDESVSFSGGSGGVERRYTANHTWTLDKSIGDVLNDLMAGAGGRLSYINGEWHIFPGAYVGASASFSSAQLLSKPTWSAQRKFNTKANYVQGTYIAPTYPYSVAGNYYGYGNTLTQDNFSYGYQPTSYPTYACDTQHGYADDQFLLEDGGIELPLTMDFASVLSVGQAQRLAKIGLLRNRQQGTGVLTFGAEALVLQPNDTFLFTMPERGWTDKLLEVSKMDISVSPGEQGVPLIQVQLTVNETDPSVYVWNSTDELNSHDAPAFTSDPGMYVTAPPTSVTLTSSAATALVQPDGTVVPRIEVQWNTPADVRVTSIEVQYQLVGASGWSDGGTVSVASNIAYIPAVAGLVYDVRIRSVRASGGVSTWVELDGFTAGLVLSVQTQDGVGIGSLVGEAYPNGTASIDCEPFTALVGQRTLSMFPSGGVAITNLAQQTLYYVYYVDPTVAGGDVTPGATTDKTDYLGKLGYFLIDSIITPYATAGTGGGTGSVRYSASTYQDLGTRGTISGSSAYDGDTSTFARVSGASGSSSYAIGDCVFAGFPAVAVPTDSTLSVTASCGLLGSGGAVSITAFVNGVTTTLLDSSAAVTSTTYTVTVPADTPLNAVSVEVIATPADSSVGEDPEPEPPVGGEFPVYQPIAKPSTATVNVSEIFIQT